MSGLGITARDAGLAWAANTSPCPHRRVPVTLVVTGEHVADLCGDCLLELPMRDRRQYQAPTLAELDSRAAAEIGRRLTS